MKKNMGTADRIIRFIIAITIIVLYVNGNIIGTAGLVLLLLSGILILTSFVGFCPLYKPFGISTCKMVK